MSVTTVGQPTISSIPGPGLHVCSGNHKKRLLIGEGNFSFALALINKHDTKVGHSSEQSLAHSIFATELNDKIHCSDCDSDSDSDSGFDDMSEKFSDFGVSNTKSNEPKQPKFCDNCITTAKRIDELKKRGVIVRLGIDGTKIHEIEEFKNAKFKRIHWNCPHDRSRFQDQTLPPLIQKFFKSCAKVQDPDDRVHITLAQPPNKAGFYQGYVYNITKAASEAGYVILKKRKFDKERYSEYEHVMTGTNKTATVTEEGVREFVFKKVTEGVFAEAKKIVKKQNGNMTVKLVAEQLIGNSEKQCKVVSEDFCNSLRNYFSCSTDDDSSDYDDSSD
ncbi:Uncharacterized protein PRO82_002182 [Candidatus Protochlamydia amoebophila]|uniref:class I SAM-dependent methyltransferase n=1 Tax=Candidatus Protochlamydia amoebophila TaxID=362787 RepID=UPI001BCA375A|nr:class I SAM-dependent methyltransferase [Candidatus Protochlamydia amoebophila]MBS4164847.1 Uncharacterized protein [Candidatus Protochlamydia amoebophila]